MIRSYKYRCYPTKPQVRELEVTLRLCRELYNAALEERILAFKRGVSLNYNTQSALLPEVKAVRPEFKGVAAQVLQTTLRRLDRAYQGFFRRVKQGGTAGFPRFQGRERFNSVEFPQAGKTGVRIGSDGRLKVTGLSGTLKVQWSRGLPSKPKTCVIKRDSCGAWFVVFTVEVEPNPLPTTGGVVGVDLGLEHFLVTSDGEFTSNPRFVKHHAQKMRVAQRRVNRRKKNSNRQRKARNAVAKLHRKTTNRRHDFHHKTAVTLLRNADNIAVEDLNIKGLARGILSRSVADVGWAAFVNILHAKAEYAGRVVHAVKPHYTSQDCSACGFREKLTLAVREFTCKQCNATHNRDHNAAKNILAKAVQQQWGRCDPSAANVVGKQPHA